MADPRNEYHWCILHRRKVLFRFAQGKILLLGMRGNRQVGQTILLLDSQRIATTVLIEYRLWDHIDYYMLLQQQQRMYQQTDFLLCDHKNKTCMVAFCADILLGYRLQDSNQFVFCWLVYFYSLFLVSYKKERNSYLLFY